MTESWWSSCDSIFMASTSILLALTHSCFQFESFNKTTVTQSLNGSRHICVIFGFLDDSTHLLTPRVNNNGKGMKEIRIIPIIAEWERSMSFYGTILDRLELTMFSNDSGSVTFGTRYSEVNQGHTSEYPFKIYMDICNTTLSHSQHKWTWIP